MADSSGFNTLVPHKISLEDELRLSVRNGLEVHFFKALSKFSGDGLAEVINKVSPRSLFTVILLRFAVSGNPLFKSNEITSYFYRNSSRYTTVVTYSLQRWTLKTSTLRRNFNWSITQVCGKNSGH